MSEIPCDCCGTVGDNPSRIICDACIQSARGKAKCCIATQAKNEKLLQACEEMDHALTRNNTSVADFVQLYDVTQAWVKMREAIEAVKGKATQTELDFQVLKEVNQLRTENARLQHLAEESQAINKRLQAENKRLRKFLNDWDGHVSLCGRNAEGFEGHDETMFNCSCGYEEAKNQALRPEAKKGE